MVDVFDRHEVRFDPRLAGCNRFVRHSDYAALEAQLAEKEAENHKYRRMISATHKNAIKHEKCTITPCMICDGGLFQCADCGAAEIETEERICTNSALSRTGAVKVDAAYLRETLAWVRRNMDEQPSQAKQQIDLALGSILSALEPAAPEGEQEPVAWRSRNTLGGADGWNYYTDQPQPHEQYYDEPLFTRPSEQALPQDVIDLVIAARIVAFEDQSPEKLHALDKASEAFASRVPWDDDPEALKAAMEAGR